MVNSPITIKPGIAALAVLGSALAGYYADQRKADVGIASGEERVRANAERIGTVEEALKEHLRNAVSRDDFVRFQADVRTDQSHYVGRDEFNQFTSGLNERLSQMSADLHDIKASIMDQKRHD